MVDIEHIGDLKPDPKNARRHTPRNVGLIRDALGEVGAARSIVIDENGVILAGNATVEAAAEAGIERVQVVDADGETVIAVRRTGLSAAQKARLALFDNRAAEVAEWDEAVLAGLKDDGLLEGLWYDDELDALLADDVAATPGAGGDEFDTTPEDGPTRCQVGDLWTLGEHRLLCGDSTRAEDVARLMGGERASAVVTDSPYGIGREGIANDDEEGLRELFDGVLAALPVDNAVVINFQSPRLFPLWLDALRAAGHKFERMLWMYKPADCTFPWRGWLLTSEAICVSSIGSGGWCEVHPFAHDCYQHTSVGSAMDEADGWHASVKPLPVVQDLMARTCPAGALVYDPFCGSGTTLIAAERLGRRCFAMEISPKYCDVILRRWEAETGRVAERVEVAQAYSHEAV